MYTCLLFDLDNTLVNAPVMGGPLRYSNHRSRLLDPDSVLILEKLASRCTLGIVTSSPLSVAVRSLRRTGLHGLFERCICARHSAPRRKPDPAALFHAMRQLGARAEQTLFIGDAHDDFLAARSANVRFLLAGWSPKTTQSPEPNSCDILQCLGDLSRICFPEVPFENIGEERNTHDNFQA